ncbi:hypothetical protein M405DRAFT_540787 [Rhizopogon salebrosus TDB-379]|nr:hypothetical protein M405DRAFT_540787 [Rhizopogon salebrosus TDB-379]
MIYTLSLLFNTGHFCHWLRYGHLALIVIIIYIISIISIISFNRIYQLPTYEPRFCESD